jgi:hypothetical protein
MFGRGKKQTEVPGRRQSVSSKPLPESFSYYRSTRRNQTLGDVRRQEIVSAQRHDVFKLLKLGVIVLVAVVALGKILYVTRSAKVDVPSAGYAYRDISEYTKIVNDGLKQNYWHGNKLTFNDATLKEYLASKLPELESVDIIIPIINNRPVIKLSVQKPGMVLATGRAAYVVTDTGRIVMELDTKSTKTQPTVPQVNDAANTSYAPGDYGFAEGSVQFINELAHQFDAKNIGIVSMTIPAGAIEELRVTPTGVGYSVRFDMTGDVVQQAGNYLAAREYLKANGLIPVDYVDARVSGRVFYK